jgi:hypothetical protein
LHKFLIKKRFRRIIYTLPTLRFEDQQLTSFSGLVIFQKLFDILALKVRLRRCFKQLTASPIFTGIEAPSLLRKRSDGTATPWP